VPAITREHGLPAPDSVAALAAYLAPRTHALPRAPALAADALLLLLRIIPAAWLAPPLPPHIREAALPPAEARLLQNLLRDSAPAHVAALPHLDRLRLGADLERRLRALVAEAHTAAHEARAQTWVADLDAAQQVRVFEYATALTRQVAGDARVAAASTQEKKAEEHLVRLPSKAKNKRR
jgi:hypothetical protein